MLSDLGHLEQRARHLYAYTPATIEQRNGQTIVQCERDELAEARARMRQRLAPLAVAVFYFVADLCLLPRVVAWHIARWRA